MSDTDTEDYEEDDGIPYSQKYPSFVALRESVWREPDEAARLIAADPSVLEARNGLGETVLHFLAVENERQAVAFLVEQGANVNTVNDFGQTPLMEAATLNYADLCRYLLAQGADPFYRSARGDTALWAAAISSRNKKKPSKTFLLMLDAIGDRDINEFVEYFYAEDIVEGKSRWVSPAAAELLISRGLTHGFTLPNKENDENDNDD